MELQLPPDAFDEDIDRWLEAVDEDPAVDLDEAHVDGMDRANRIAYRVGQLRRQKAETLAFAKAETMRITEWYSVEERRLNAKIRFLEQLAGAYHRRLLDEDPGRRTVRLPQGELKARKKRDEYVYANPVGFVDWAEAAGREELIRRKAEPDRNAARKVLQPVTDDGQDPEPGEELAVVDPETGEVVPGLSVLVGWDEFTVATPGADDV